MTVYTMDLTKKITFWNKSAEKITGYSKAEVMGSFCSDGLLRHINDAGDELCEKGCPLTRTLEDGKIRCDDVLKMVSQTILNVLRSLDCLCRWGGDEFLVIVPNVDLSTLGFVGEKSRMFIEKTWLEKKGLLLKVTLSVGGTLALKTDTQNSLIERADAQMYHSKKKGRNTVSII